MQLGKHMLMEHQQKSGVGIYMTWKNNLQVTNVLIAAKVANITTPIQAVVEALITATQIDSSLLLQEPIFFTDNLSLAKAPAASRAKDPTVLWEIRRQGIQFQETTQPLREKIIHVTRNLNIVAHHCAQHAVIHSRTLLICSCRNSTHSNLACLIFFERYQLHPASAITSCPNGIKDAHNQKLEELQK
jgi:hypothetical protein